ncbi:hypothetical protein [Peristeroidobacter soli]|uniref:hypothetical protein n=1 Tax=Peristeroidobacter soli TaxID=2497877 RepID=UPI00101C83ED|nr:hypothetical protein [Peristeroidobacter soli]
MKKLMVRATALVALSLTAQCALSDCASSHCEDVRVLTLYTPPAPDNNTYLKVSGTTANLGCSLYAGVYVRVPSASTRFKEYIANLMAVQLAERAVSFGVDSGQSTCTLNSLWTNTP